MNSEERSLKLSEDFDKALKKVASACEVFDDLEGEISEFIDNKFENDEELCKKYDIPYGEMSPSEYFDTLELIAEYNADLPTQDEIDTVLKESGSQDRALYMGWLKKIHENPMSLADIPKDRLTRRMCLEAVMRDGMVLSSVPQSLQDGEICLHAIQRGGRLSDVAESLRTHGLCLTAVSHCWQFLRDVPDGVYDRTTCLAAVKRNGMALQYVPERFRDNEICAVAVGRNTNAFAFVPACVRKEAKNAEMFLARQKYENTFFTKRVGEVIAAVQTTLLPDFPDDTQWNVEAMQWDDEKTEWHVQAAETCSADHFADSFAMTDIATDNSSQIEISLNGIFSPDSLEQLVRKRIDNPDERFSSFDHELLGLWLDLQNAAVSEFARQHGKDAADILKDWPMRNYCQEYGLSLNEKRDIAEEVLAIDEALRSFILSNDDCCDDYEYCKANIVSDDLQTGLLAVLRFSHGTSGDAWLSLGMGHGVGNYEETHALFRIKAARLASPEPIYERVRRDLDRNVGTAYDAEENPSPAM